MNAHKLTVGMLILSSLAFAAADKDETVEATGEAAVVGGDEVKAKKDAHDAALRAAVEQVAGTLVSSDTLTKNNQLVSDRIYSRSEGYVKKWSDEKCAKDGNAMRCTLKAVVSTASLDKDLQAVRSLVAQLGRKRLVIVTQEHAITPSGQIISSSALSDELKKEFEADGWNLINPAALNGKLHLSAGASMGQAEAKEVGNLAQADYVLYGTVNFRHQDLGGPGGQMIPAGTLFPVTGEYAFTVFATDSGSELGNVSGTFSSKDRPSRISYEQTAFDLSRRDGPKIVGEVRKAVYSHLGSGQQNGARIVTQVEGLDFDSAEDFGKFLSTSVTGVRDVSRVRYEDGKANFDVVYLGPAEDLAREFSRKTFKKEKVTVRTVTGSRVVLKVGK